jgi:hypothetical protein
LGVLDDEHDARRAFRVRVSINTARARRSFMRVGKLAAVVGVTACALGAGSAAVAAATPQGGKIRVFLTVASQTKSRIVITGAIGDYGTALSVNANGKVDPSGNFEKVTLKQGGFLVNGTALNKKLDHTKPTINASNCSFVFSGSAPTTISDGTGAYAGITGKIAITLTFAAIAPKTANGCNFKSNKVTGGYQSITGTGSVSFQ